MCHAYGWSARKSDRGTSQGLVSKDALNPRSLTHTDTLKTRSQQTSVNNHSTSLFYHSSRIVQVLKMESLSTDETALQDIQTVAGKKKDSERARLRRLRTRRKKELVSKTLFPMFPLTDRLVLIESRLSTSSCQSCSLAQSANITRVTAI